MAGATPVAPIFSARTLRALARLPRTTLVIVGLDLASRRSEAIRRQAARFGVEPRTRLLGYRDDIPELMAAAEAETGLTDYGSDSFRPGLERLTEALRSEAQLSELGSDIMRMRLVGHLASRLQVNDTVKRFPQIEDRAIRAPLFIIGLPRTGTWASVAYAWIAGTRSWPRATRRMRSRWATGPSRSPHCSSTARRSRSAYKLHRAGTPAV